jgi:PIN domain nuclease of toxin-antitoxin system
LAALHREPGAEVLTERFGLMDTAIMSAVNVTEAYGKLVGKGLDPKNTWAILRSMIPEILPFDEEQAKIAGGMVTLTRPMGLSLGDRACLALAIVLKAPVYTTDRVWKGLKLGVPVHVMR